MSGARMTRMHHERCQFPGPGLRNPSALLLRSDFLLAASFVDSPARASLWTGDVVAILLGWVRGALCVLLLQGPGSTQALGQVMLWPRAWREPLNADPQSSQRPCGEGIRSLFCVVL